METTPIETVIPPVEEGSVISGVSEETLEELTAAPKPEDLVTVENQRPSLPELTKSTPAESNQ